MKLLKSLRQSEATNQKIVAVLYSAIGIAALAIVFAGCKKEDADGCAKNSFDLVYGKRWMTLSQEVTPSWTYPATGKTYTDVFVFAKEVFPCVTDDLIAFFRDGTGHAYHEAKRCDPNEPDEGPLTYYVYTCNNDSLILLTPLEVPGQPVQILNIRCKVEELTNEKLVLRYNQQLPFTNTWHTIRETYKAVP